ncbi:sulfotransferase [Dasania sp. GY-MA-18]|uniref:Sulfotransferase n=1 Tax=Dasania phycosphaerae TaxID=2950436 RepID=A0A9J6RM77_9GAMM|nr:MULTISPECIES: sulfotransferase [Dasania]MCR8922856.1 sulfotransferase [Dasania sp. GY-MA-18]MCZ0865287.1 sulfotransferase [Dasania phycosphaerae]MCZ0869012.1 sulfotransferase [Dasania phycosphaerae]
MNTQIKMNEQQMLQQLLKQGFEHLTQGRIREAADCCQRAIHIKPDLVQAHFLVGLVALEGQDRKTAFQAFNSVTKLQNNHPAAWAQIAKLCMSDGQINLADNALKQALKHPSNDPMVHDLLGTVLSQMGEHESAQKCFQKAIELQPNHPPYMLNYANNLVYHGKLKESETVLESILNIQPNSPQAHWSLSGAKKATDSKHIETMQSLAAQKNIHPRALPFYFYAMGKEYEDLQEWDKAFEAFSKGAEARRKTVEFDEAHEIETFKHIENTFTKEWFEQAKSGHSNNAPIFVLGQPRTGTTLVERIITSHSQVQSAGELQQFGLAIRRLSNHQDPRRFSPQLFKDAILLDPEKIGGLYSQTTAKLSGGKPRFVDKLPQNYMMIPLILKALPNAKIVHLTRNPMDACFASYKQLFADAYLHSYDQAEMARHHARYRHLMGVWRERFPGQFFDISYEATASNLEPNARALIDFLELPWEDACLNFHQQKAAVSTASSVQVREPAHTRSIGRWKRYESQLSTMLSTLREQGVPIDD